MDNSGDFRRRVRREKGRGWGLKGFSDGQRRESWPPESLWGIDVCVCGKERVVGVEKYFLLERARGGGWW